MQAHFLSPCSDLTTIVPNQDVAPWASVVNKLMSDEDQYKRLSDKVRSTTEQWLRDVDEKALEKWLTSL